ARSAKGRIQARLEDSFCCLQDLRFRAGNRSCLQALGQGQDHVGHHPHQKQGYSHFYQGKAPIHGKTSQESTAWLAVS
ncbi:hypothetical protein NL475_26865, partial [Klebsiella pneumoniae]|nr:hypothetical protein [Klebsiella pneumoniae]